MEITQELADKIKAAKEDGKWHYIGEPLPDPIFEPPAISGIIHAYPDEVPPEGTVVFAEGIGGSRYHTGRNGRHLVCDRCVYENGKFIGGGDYPIPQYEMKDVRRWFSISEYDDNTPEDMLTLSFEIASEI